MCGGCWRTRLIRFWGVIRFWGGAVLVARLWVTSTWGVGLGRGWAWAVAGVACAVGSWSTGIFLRLRTGLRRIRRVAQAGGVPWAALAAGGVVGKSAHGSESLRMRHVGGWRQRLVGA